MHKTVFHTSGDGFWSGRARAVDIVDIQLDTGRRWEGEDTINGELRVYFDTKTWNVDNHGLIYTDRLFVKELRAFLDAHGLPGKDVCYSEQGMQGYDYVSLDAGTEFYEAWMEKFSIPYENLVEVW
jgi:hypothetical protein